jgi:Zn-dependent protease with chaperone function
VTQAAPTILAVETDSAWIVIVAVSLVTLCAALLLRRLIGRPGGLLSGVLLALPLLLPLVAALAYERAVLPEFAVLQPAGAALSDRSRDLLHLLYLSDGQGRGTFYALIGSFGPWILLVGVSISSFMLLRRAVGMVLLHRLVVRCRTPARPPAATLDETVRRLAETCGLKRFPQLLLLPPGLSGAFAVGVKHPKILISEDLIEGLEEDELAAVLAHEVSHIQSRDVPVVFMAGLLRDMIAWNPVAHVAYRRLTSDREIEADRSAAAMTGSPLAVASGILKMYEIVKGRRPCTGQIALAFLRPGGRIARRVSHLLDVADGRVTVRNAGRLPYAVAALLVALLGLQAGARIAADRAALAIVWGTPDVSESAYPSKRAPAEKAQRKNDRGKAKPRSNLVEAAPAPQRGSRLRNFSSIKEQNVDEWIRDMTKWMRKQGGTSLSPLTLRWEARQDWTAVPLQCTVGSICIYRMERGTLLP